MNERTAGSIVPNEHGVSYPQRQGLLDALGERRLLVVVGPLVREAAGLVGRRGLVDTSLKEPEFGEDEPEILDLAAAGRFADAFEAIKFRLGPRFAAVFEPLLAGPKVAPPASLRALAGLAEQLSLILTTNLDNLVETTLSGAWVALAGATADLAARTRTVFKLLGTAHVVSSWKFTADGLQNATYRQAYVRQEVTAALRSHRLLLVGFRGDDELLEQLVAMREYAPEDRNAPEWVALVPPGTPEIARQALGRRGVQLVMVGSSAESVVAYDAAVAAHLRSLAQPGTPLSPTAPAFGPTLTGNPYPGLAPFVEDQAGQFFGRADACAALLGKLGRRGPTHARWLVVTGPSGVGKSSLLAAGLVPALRGGATLPDAPTRWAVAQLRPGREVLRNLAGAVRDALADDLGIVTAPELLTRETLQRDRALADFLAPRLEGSGLLVVLDQLEEVFTTGAAEDRPYLDALLVRSLQDVEVPFYLVTAIRSDCAGEFGRHLPQLAEQQNLGTMSARHDLEPLRPHELREAIERPAELTGRTLEPGLAERILLDAGVVRADAGGAVPDAALPLVAHVLRALHDRTTGSTLTLRAYEALGGVGESLTRSADELLAALPAEFAVEQVRDLLVALVELHPHGRDTRRVLSWASALAAAGGDDEADEAARVRAVALVRRLSGAASQPGAAPGVRLLVTRGKGEHVVVDLVHDALLRGWSTLRGWLQEDRANGLLRQELERAAEGWVERSRPNDELWRGGRLARAEALYRRRLSPEAREFLAAAAKLAHDEATAREDEQAVKLRAAENLATSEQARATDAQRKNRWLLGLGGVLLVASTLAVFQYRRASDAAELAESRLEAANTIVERIVLDALPKLADISGTAAVRKQIHGDLEILQQTLLRGADDDMWSLRNRMAQHLDAGDVAMTHDGLASARHEFTEALRMAEALLERDPQGARARRDLCALLERLGDLEVQAGNLPSAQAHFERSLVLAEARTKADPQNVQAQRDLCLVLNKLGNVEESAGDIVNARAHVERSMVVAEATVKADPQNTQAQHNLSISLANLGDLEMQVGNPAGAQALYERGLVVLDTLAKAAPHSAQAQTALSIALNKLGSMKVQTGRVKDARAHFERSLAVADALVKADRQSTPARRNLSVALERLGDVERKLGNLAGARAHLERCLAVRDELATADRQSAQAQSDLSLALANLGDVDMEAGNLAGARALHERALAVREALARADPNDAERSYARVSSHMMLYFLAKAEKNTAKMLEHLTTADALVDTMAANGQVAGFAQREGGRAYIKQLLTELR